MHPDSIHDLAKRVREGSMDRRSFLQRAMTIGLSAGAATMMASNALAQSASLAASPEASPAASPVAGPVTRSITRTEYMANIASTFELGVPESTGGQVILAATNDIGTLNPIIRSDISSLYLLANMFNSLAVQSVIDGSMVPDLADYWEVSGDGLTFTFYLNKDATWHDGNPVTSDDVAFSFASAMDEAGFSPFRADLVANIAESRAVDTHTFELVAQRPIAIFLNKTANLVPIMPKHIWESVPVANWPSAPGSTGSDPSQVIGSGPFKFGEWVQSDHASMVRNDAYWVPEQKATIDSFTFRVVPDQSTAMQSFKTGESDIAAIPAAQLGEYKANPNVTVIQYDTFSWAMVTANQDPERGTFGKDKAVRQALIYALDRDSVVSTILGGSGTRADGTQPLMSRAYAPEKLTTIYNYDPEKAKTLLDEAGWIDSDGDGVREKDGVKLSTDFLFGGANPQNVQIVTYLQQAWKEVGIAIEPLSLVDADLLDRVVTKGDFQLGLMGIDWTEEDQGILFRSDATPEKGGFNLSRYSNPAYDKLNDAQLVEFDDARRIELIQESNDILNEDMAEGMLYFGKAAVGFSSRMHNYVPNAYGTWWQIPYVWIERG